MPSLHSLYSGAQLLVWIRSLLITFGLDFPSPSLNSDSVSTIFGAQVDDTKMVQIDVPLLSHTAQVAFQNLKKSTTYENCARNYPEDIATVKLQKCSCGWKQQQFRTQISKAGMDTLVLKQVLSHWFKSLMETQPVCQWAEAYDFVLYLRAISGLLLLDSIRRVLHQA